MRLLALDHGGRTGWCAGDGARLPAIGSRLNPHAGSPDALEALYLDHERWLEGLILDFKPRVVAFEAPISVPGTGVKSLRVTIGLAAITGLTCYRRTVVIREVTVAQTKQALAGRGNATKDQMVAAARAYGYPVKFPDEADAFAVWLATFRAFATPEQSSKFDPLFFKGESPCQDLGTTPSVSTS